MNYLQSSIKLSLDVQFQKYLFSKTKSFFINPHKVVIDFSSPNIAKPFHPGHFRATLVGNFIANINKLFGHDVHKINYLGDWGTQFGYLMYGMKKYNKDLNEVNSLQEFSEVYSYSYKNLKSEEDVKCMREMLNKLENGDEDLKNTWRNIRDISIENLKLTYQRLGIEFDSYEFESQYVQASKSLVQNMKERNLPIIDEGHATLYIVNSDYKIPLLTKEGFSLYITRDIAAAISRFKQHKPDRIHYVVENGQTLHFQTLKTILTDYGYKFNEFDKSAQPTDLHIKFGLVEKMSSRKGDIIYFDKVLDSAKTLMMAKLQIKKITITNPEDFEELAENLGKTLLYCEFLRSPRQNLITFTMLRDNLGFRLQYCRCVLNTLENKCKENSIYPSLNDSFKFESYDYFKYYNSAYLLVQHMENWHKVLFQCYMESESSYLIHFVTKMVGLVNKALLELDVIGCKSMIDSEIRLKLFSVSKFILDVNYQLLGLPVIEKI